MERLSFRPEEARRPPDERLVGVSIAWLERRAGCRVGIFRIDAGGRIARHPAVRRQLLAVLDGSGVVSGGDGVEVALARGDAVVWDAGEEHETRSDGGLTAVVVEEA